MFAGRSGLGISTDHPSQHASGAQQSPPADGYAAAELGR